MTYVDEPVCEHGNGTEGLTREGLPRCPQCRRELLTERDRLQQSVDTLVRIPRPTADHAAAAAGDD